MIISDKTASEFNEISQAESAKMSDTIAAKGQSVSITTQDIASAMAQLSDELRTYADGVGPSDLQFVAAGLEFLVCRARLRGASSEFAVRSPWKRYCQNDNDAFVDSRLLLEQEAHLLMHVRTRGLPAPNVHDLHFGRHCDFLITEFIETDGLSVPERELGELMGRLHQCDPPDWLPVHQRPGPL